MATKKQPRRLRTCKLDDEAIVMVARPNGNTHAHAQVYSVEPLCGQAGSVEALVNTTVARSSAITRITVGRKNYRGIEFPPDLIMRGLDENEMNETDESNHDDREVALRVWVTPRGGAIASVHVTRSCLLCIHDEGTLASYVTHFMASRANKTLARAVRTCVLAVRDEVRKKCNTDIVSMFIDGYDALDTPLSLLENETLAALRALAFADEIK